MASNKRPREQEQEDQVAEEKQVQEQEPTMVSTKRPCVQEEEQVQSELYLCFTSVEGPKERLRSVAVSDLIAETKSDKVVLTLEKIKIWASEYECSIIEMNYENGDDNRLEAAEEAFRKLVKAGKSFELAVHPPSFVLNVLREY